MVIIITLYLALVWLLFFKLRWLPWNKFTQWVCILVGTVIFSGFLVGLQSLTPSSTEGVITARMVDIAPQVSGRITSVEVEAMQPVEEGAVLFEIDPTAYRARLNDLEASLKLALSREKQAATLYERQVGSLADLQRAEAEVGQLQGRIESANFDLENTVVRAPGNGVVPILPLKEGVQVSPSRSVLVFMVDEEIIIGARFAQKALQTVKVGDMAMVNFPAIPGRVFESEVMAIPHAISEGQLQVSGALPSVQELRMTRIWPVLIKLPDEFPPELRKAGLAAQVYIHTEEAGTVGIVAVVLQWVSTSLDAIL